MAKIEDSKFMISSSDPPSAYGHTSNSKDETNASNNSSAQKKNEKSKSKSAKSQSNRKSSTQGTSQNQNSRRSSLLDRLRIDGYVYDSHTQGFLNFLGRTNPESRNVKSKVFKNQLMLAENMDDIPKGFAKNWLMVVCPVGSRCLVVASMGHTGAYSKTGYHIISHPSNLPMGNKTVQGYGSCVLDCIYCNETETYFVLDIMCWDGQPLYECETHVRFRQLQERIREYDLGRPSRQNPYAFVPLKTFTPAKSNICGAVRTAPYMIDGLLFYHKEATYTPGSTPLVLWLTLDRLPTKMKIEIPEMGIITAVSYKDPVALALAHGVSPAIISQVYPTSAGMRGHVRNGIGQGRDGQPLQSRHYREFSTLPASHSYSQGPQGYYSGQQIRRGMGPLYPNDDYGYLSEMMLNLNIGHGSQGLYGQYDHQMGTSGSSFYTNYNSNNNAPNYNRSDSVRGRYSHQSPQAKSYTENKKRKTQSPKSDKKQSNWLGPHSAMKSQWMTSKPENFENDYLTCLTPMAKRRIIVASKGKTCTYNKYGKLIDTFTSSLPNGAPNLFSGSNELVVLDSMWCGSLQKFYVFDVMHWRQQPFYDAEAEFRFFWLQDKITNVTLKSSKKEFTAELLPMISSDRESITDALSTSEYKIDGLLCYRKSSKYSLTPNTHALWLKLDMMEELLGYPPPGGVSYKPSTEKERKQRMHFVNIDADVKVPLTSETSYTVEEEEEEDSNEGKQNVKVDELNF